MRLPSWPPLTATAKPLADNRKIPPRTGLIIPRFNDQNSFAQSRNPMDMIFQGCSTSLFQA